MSSLWNSQIGTKGGVIMAENTSTIVVNTEKMKEYAGRLDAIIGRTQNIEAGLNAIYAQSGLADIQALTDSHAVTKYNDDVRRVSVYLRETAEDFESVERKVSGIMQG